MSPSTEDTSQSQMSERSDISYNPERIPYGMNIKDYSATWLEGWTNVPPKYTDDSDVYKRHRHSTRY